MTFLPLREPVSALTHGLGLVLALPGTIQLWRRAGDPARRASLFVYGLSLAFCYGASAIYHGVRGEPRLVATFALVDRIGIFALIAGTYTPIAWNLMRPLRGRLTVAMAWTLALTGSVVQLVCGTLPNSVGTVFYLVMGWGALLCADEVARVLSRRALRPIFIGGVFYSVGAILNLLGRPVLWPDVFGPHELFHLFVMAGSLVHYRFLLTVVAPTLLPPPADLEATTRQRWRLGVPHLGPRTTNLRLRAYRRSSQ
jgi:hemolysin III